MSLRASRSLRLCAAGWRPSLDIVSNQYRAGTVTYLDVVQAQTTLLSAENNLLNIRNRRLAASVGLVKALGGGWEQPTS